LEWDRNANQIFKHNFNPIQSLNQDIAELIDGSIDYHGITNNEKIFLENYPHSIGPELLIGGPPCQGHSDLNNHSRRSDPRNNLYLRMIRAAKLLRPTGIVIENVPTVIHSKERVVQRARDKLCQMGYHPQEAILWANDFGVPQKRKRHFLIASMVKEPNFSILDSVRMNKSRTLDWAISDLIAQYDDNDTFNSSSRPSAENQRRMNWLLDNDEYDLPNEERPKCHQNGHNYPAVYGRLRSDRPTDTITAGFGSTGQGRFMHPSATPGRTLTPHEAARVQTFPDWFDFGNHRRGTLSKTIGNAVPPLLAMHVGLVALDAIIP